VKARSNGMNRKTQEECWKSYWVSKWKQ